LRLPEPLTSPPSAVPNSNGQSVSFLIRRFREVGLRPDARHGQNFLIDLNLIDLLLRSAELSDRDVVVEVGTGTGSLTAMMADRAAQVISFEIDAHLHTMASEELAGRDNVQLILHDVLKNKNHFYSEFLPTLERSLAEVPGGRLKLVANLPYNVATPVISNLLASHLPPQRMVVTIQKELADRIVAVPGTKDYGALSIWVQSQCMAEIIRVMPPTVFWPKPKVHSAIIRIDLEPERRAAIPELPFFQLFARSLFMHRRKFLRASLVNAFKQELTKVQVDEILTELEFGPDVRAEQLDLPTVMRLYEAVRGRM